MAQTRQTCCVCLQTTTTYTTVPYPGGRRFHFCSTPACQAQGEREQAQQKREREQWSGEPLRYYR